MWSEPSGGRQKCLGLAVGTFTSRRRPHATHDDSFALPIPLCEPADLKLRRIVDRVDAPQLDSAYRESPEMQPNLRGTAEVDATTRTPDPIRPPEGTPPPSAVRPKAASCRSRRPSRTHDDDVVRIYSRLAPYAYTSASVRVATPRRATITRASLRSSVAADIAAPQRGWSGRPDIPPQRSWRLQAAREDDPRSRPAGAGVGKAQDQRFHAQVAATLAPRAHRKHAVQAIIAIEVIYDYLDALTELPVPDPLGNGRRLSQTFTDAISIHREPQ